MKLVLTATIAMLASATPAEADCGCGVWPLTEQVVEGKPYIVIEAGCVPSTLPTWKLALADAAGKAIPLTPLTTHDGPSNIQIVFTPDRALAPGKYTVMHSDRWETTKLAITVVAAPTKASPPQWIGAATVLRQAQVEFGCGPAKVVEVEAANDASLAFVELEDDKKVRHSGYVRVSKGKLSIGHGMCGGAFALTKGRGYTANVTLLSPERGTSSTSKQVTFRYSP